MSLNSKKSLPFSVAKRQQFLHPKLFSCSCLFQILSQWELSPVVRSVLAYCCLWFYLRLASSGTVNVKTVSAHIQHAYTICVSFSFINFLSVILISQTYSIYTKHIFECSYSIAICYIIPILYFSLIQKGRIILLFVIIYKKIILMFGLYRVHK